METSVPPAFCIQVGRNDPYYQRAGIEKRVGVFSMEEFPVMPEMTRSCKRLLNGEVNVNILVKEILRYR